MPSLLRKPDGHAGKLYDITPENAGWRYVGFGLYRRPAGRSAAEATGETEVILVLVEGKAEIGARFIQFFIVEEVVTNDGKITKEGKVIRGDYL